MQSKNSTTTVLIVLILVFTFPLWIGIAGGLFGLVVGLFGGMIGIIAGIFGAIVGVFGWLFNWHWPFVGFFHWNIFWIVMILLAVVMISKSKRRV